MIGAVLSTSHSARGHDCYHSNSALTTPLASVFQEWRSGAIKTVVQAYRLAQLPVTVGSTDFLVSVYTLTHTPF